jgi:protein subunit release factor A
MNPKFEQIENRFKILTDRLADPSVQGSGDFHELVREFKRLDPTVQKVRTLRRVESEIHQAEGLLSSSEPDLKALGGRRTEKFAGPIGRFGGRIGRIFDPPGSPGRAGCYYRNPRRNRR